MIHHAILTRHLLFGQNIVTNCLIVMSMKLSFSTGLSPLSLKSGNIIPMRDSDVTLALSNIHCKVGTAIPDMFMNCLMQYH